MEIILSLTLIVYVIIAFYNYKANELSQIRGKFSILNSFLEEYYSEVMSVSMRSLRSFKDENGDEYANIYAQLKSSNSSDPNFLILDNNRRYLKGFFKRLVKLSESNCLDLALSKTFFELDGVNHFIEIVEPIENAINANNSKELFESLKNITSKPRLGPNIKS